MYNVLKLGRLVSVTETLEEAVELVRYLECGMNRYLEHSPFTVERNEETTEEQPSLEVKKPMHPEASLMAYMPKQYPHLAWLD